MPMPRSTRYVVLEWEQRGTDRPELAVDNIYASLIDADDIARSMAAEAKEAGTSATFTVHEVNMDVVTL